MLRVELNTEEQTQLEHTFKTTADRRLRHRCQAVLMANRGRKRKAIAQDLGVHRTTVRQWLNQYQQHGLSGLTIQWAPGQPARIPESFAVTLQQWVKEGPQSCGLDRANWTYEELAVHFYRTTGIVRSSAPPCASSVSVTISGPIARRIAICEVTRTSSKRPERNSLR